VPKHHNKPTACCLLFPYARLSIERQVLARWHFKLYFTNTARLVLFAKNAFTQTHDIRYRFATQP